MRLSVPHCCCLLPPSPQLCPDSVLLTIRDPWLRGQGAPFLALAQLDQVLKAQQGAYAGHIPRMELGKEEQKVSQPDLIQSHCPTTSP